MEEQWAWLTNCKCVYTRPSISLYRQREVIDQSCEPSWLEIFNQGWKYFFYMVIREMAAIRNLVIVILCIWKSMYGEIDSTRGQMWMLKLINGNCYIKAGDEIREVWTNLKRFHHTLAVWKNLMHFFLMSTLHSDFFFLGDLVFLTTSSLHTCIKNDSESEEREIKYHVYICHLF